MRQMIPQQPSKWKIQKVLLHQYGSLAGNVEMAMSIYDMSDSCDKISKMSCVHREPFWLFSKGVKRIDGCSCSGESKNIPPLQG
jgi:hypothetical protein